MNEQTYLSALAGVLHDIGKLMLRAAKSGRRLDFEMSSDANAYVGLSAFFVRRYVPQAWRESALKSVEGHHAPRHKGERVVALADYLSGGIQKEDEGREGGDEAEPKQLRSIFTAVRADDRPPSPEQRARAYLPLAPLQLSRQTLFPADEQPEAEVWRRYADELWLPFAEAAEALAHEHSEGRDPSIYLESLLLLMQHYAWCVPSAYEERGADVSLYDHSRMTGALAAILTDMDDESLKRLLKSPWTEEDLVLLVGGDISGVQNFIYTITARGATPGLRGRSFYLQLLTEATARFVLRELDLPITNLLYAGGGNFYLLARPGDQNKLGEIRRAIGRVLLQHHRGDLYLALAAAPLSGRDFLPGRIGDGWARLHEALQEVKHRRFAELSQGELVQLFRPQGRGGDQEGACQVCGQEHPRIKKEEQPNGESVRKCPACLAFEDLGDDLRNARFLALDLVEPQPVNVDLAKPYGTWQEALRALGIQAKVSAHLSALGQGPTTGYRVLLALDDDGLSEIKPGPRRATGRRLLVNVTPILRKDEWKKLQEDGSFPEADRAGLPAAGRVKPFSVLAHQANGIKRLGVLRMDVDDLGKLFREGLGERATLSRVAGLSFAVSLYFEGWVGQAAAEVNRRQAHPDYPDRERLYAIYSGGDDLFFVGSWDAVAELAIRIRADLNRYTAQHPGIHASGGLVLIGGKRPLYQAARDAGEAERQAKLLRWRDQRGERRDKDAFWFLGEPFPWDRFGLETECTANLQTVHGLMHFLSGLTRRNGGAENGGKAAPKALLRRLVDLYGQYVEAREAWRRSHGDVTQEGEPQVLWGPWTWRAVYTLARMKERTKKPELKQLSDELRDTDYRIMERIGVAARWADLLGRRS